MEIPAEQYEGEGQFEENGAELDANLDTLSPHLMTASNNRPKPQSPPNSLIRRKDPNANMARQVQPLTPNP